MLGVTVMLTDGLTVTDGSGLGEGSTDTDGSALGEGSVVTVGEPLGSGVSGKWTSTRQAASEISPKAVISNFTFMVYASVVKDSAIVGSAYEAVVKLALKMTKICSGWV